MRGESPSPSREKKLPLPLSRLSSTLSLSLSLPSAARFSRPLERSECERRNDDETETAATPPFLASPRLGHTHARAHPRSASELSVKAMIDSHSSLSSSPRFFLEWNRQSTPKSCRKRTLSFRRWGGRFVGRQSTSKRTLFSIGARSRRQRRRVSEVRVVLTCPGKVCTPG